MKVEPEHETVETHSHGIIYCNLSYIQREKLRVDLECGCNEGQILYAGKTKVDREGRKKGRQIIAALIR